MKLTELTDLIKQIDRSSLRYLNFEDGKTKVTLSKDVPAEKPAAAPLAAVQPLQLESVAPAAPVEVPEPAAEAEAEVEVGKVETSPMVGVVYLQPNPEADPFIQVGDTVTEGDTLLIIEAMKLMNEIQASHSGVVTEILVDNEEVVEYGQALVRIKA